MLQMIRPVEVGQSRLTIDDSMMHNVGGAGTSLMMPDMRSP